MIDPQHPSVRVDVPRYWLAFLPGLTISAVALCAAAASRIRLPGWVGAAVLAAVVVVPGVRFASTEPTFHPNSGQLPYEVVQNLPAGPQIYTDGRTLRILPAYRGATDLDFRDFTRKGGRPRSGQYVLIFSDTDETCEFCKLDYDLWKAEGNALPLADYRLVWESTGGKARLYQVP